MKRDGQCDLLMHWNRPAWLKTAFKSSCLHSVLYDKLILNGPYLDLYFGSLTFFATPLCQITTQRLSNALCDFKMMMDITVNHFCCPSSCQTFSG